MNASFTYNGETNLLTTEHAASSYGQPVLVIDGQVYGPGDIVGGNTLASAWVMVLRNMEGCPSDFARMADRFTD